jgi:hypothetical protein
MGGALAALNCTHGQPGSGSPGFVTADQCPNEPSQLSSETVIIPEHRDRFGRLIAADEIPSLIHIAPTTQDIPEFHDCQKLLEPLQRGGGAALTYGPLVGAFAHESLDSFAGRFDGPDGVLVVDAYNYTAEAYEPLGIGQGHNCLYIAHDPKAAPADGWTAKMLSSGVKQCPTTPAGSTPKTLHIRRLTWAGYDTANYPPVTRWEWDPASLEQVLGVKCGAAWCQVSGNRLPAIAGLLRSDRPPLETVPGWFDEQFIMDPNSGAPSQVSAIFRPDPQVAQWTQLQYKEDGDWKRVGTIEMPSPLTPTTPGKLSLTAGPHDVFLRYHTVKFLFFLKKRKWQARIDTRGAAPQYLDVHRVDHQAFEGTIPNTVRWRWVAEDETEWVPCGLACCNVHEPE